MIRKNRCVGCGACVNVCPTLALEMKVNEEGFNLPEIDEDRCIHCNACKNVCPIMKLREPYIDTANFYAMKSKIRNIQLNSASGGIFPEIAMYFLEKGGYVWGAAFDENFNVKHRFVTDKEELPLLYRSKYVQSDIKDVFRSLKKQLSSGSVVLFSGTPCQTTAIANYVGEKLCKNLYLVDIVCHGVPSPAVWQEYLFELSNYKSEKKEDITEIYFKFKEEEKNWVHPGFCVIWKDGQKYLDFSNQTWYENGFLGNLYVRPCCHKCAFKSLSSISDLMIGDFWGCQELYPEIFSPSGVSLIAAKTKKGKLLTEILMKQTEYISISKDEACKYNARIITSSRSNRKRKLFWKIFCNSENSMDEMEKLIEGLTNKSFLDRVLDKILIYR